MLAYRSGADWMVRAPAKLNLLFEILARRDDGFHEIETVMVPISLFDTLTLQATQTGRIDFSWSGRPWDAGCLGEIPSDERNLVVRALRLLAQRSGTSLGATVHLAKRIPSAAGLGGGSSDAAAALWAANRAWQLEWSQERLAGLAAELGSDVPFFLAAQAAVCRGRGELVEPVQVGCWNFVLVKPSVGLSTAEVFAASRPAQLPRRAEPLLRALQTGEHRAVKTHMGNRLEPAAATLSPEVARLRQAFEDLDLVACQLTGSGSCFFGVCRHQRHARRAAARLRIQGWEAVWHLQSCGAVA